MDKLVMGYWDCPYCKTKKIKGTLQDCPNCGATRDKNVKFYMDEDNIEYLNEDESKNKNKGCDWLCDYCKTLNPAINETCLNCGASKNESKHDYFSLHNTEKQTSENVNSVNNIVNNLDDDNNYCNNVNNYVNSVNNNEESNKIISLFTKSNYLVTKIISSVLIIALLISGLAYLLTPKVKDINIENCSWKYSFDLQAYETVKESGWSLPDKAVLLNTKLEIRSYRQVIDHYETKTRTYTVQEFDGYRTEYTYQDNGDGTFSQKEHQVPEYKSVTKTETYDEPVYRQEPVMDTKYYYNIDKWITKKTYTTEGIDKNPYYKDIVLKDKQRIANKKQKYYVKAFEKNKKLKTYSIDEENWKKLNNNMKVKVKISRNKIIEIVSESKK